MTRVTLETDLLCLQDVREKFATLDPSLFAVLPPSDHSKTRSSEIVVTLATTGGTVLGIFLRGLLDLLKEKSGGKIVLRGSSGRSVEAPAGISEQQLSRLIKQAEGLEVRSIRIE
jgi:hypothetical protein